MFLACSILERTFVTIHTRETCKTGPVKVKIDSSSLRVLPPPGSNYVPPPGCREAPVSMAAADPFARFVPSTTPALAPEPDAPTVTLREVMSPPASVPEVQTTVSEIREAPPCTLTVTLDKSAYNAGETVTGTVKIENDVAMVTKVRGKPANPRRPDAPRGPRQRRKLTFASPHPSPPPLGTPPTV